jgi:hypothetical protein
MIVFLMSCFFRIFWESKKFEGQTDKVEPWYGTAYVVEKITGSMIQVCRQVDLNEKLLDQLSSLGWFRSINLS